MIARFFHRLFHYHCAECLEEELRTNNCPSCETLRQQLALSHQENARLLDLVIRQNEPRVELIEEPKEPVTLPRRVGLWSTRAAELERASAEKAAILRKHSEESIASLEKELGVENAS